jgi:hypothetical protein
LLDDNPGIGSKVGSIEKEEQAAIRNRNKKKWSLEFSLEIQNRTIDKLLDYC